MSVSKSKVSRAIVALGVASLMLASIAPAAAHKPHHGGKHGHPMQNEGVPKPQPAHPMQNEGVPKPQAAPSIGDGQWHANPTPPVVRDHRAKPVVRDQRKLVRDHTGGKVPVVASKKVPCLGSLCGVKKMYSEAKRIAIKRNTPH